MTGGCGESGWASRGLSGVGRTSEVDIISASMRRIADCGWAAGDCSSADRWSWAALSGRACHERESDGS